MLAGIALLLLVANFSVVLGNTVEPNRALSDMEEKKETTSTAFVEIIEKRVEALKKLKDEFLKEMKQNLNRAEPVVKDAEGARDSIIILHHENGGRMPAKEILSKRSQLR